MYKTIVPKQATYPSDQEDMRSCGTFSMLFYGQRAKPEIKEPGNTMANIDGYVILLNQGNLPIGKVSVQIKTYNKKTCNGQRKFPIPYEIIGYADFMATETVVFVAVNNEDNEFYWKIISKDFIEECKLKGNQNTYTYHFSPEEVANTNNIDKTISLWLKSYRIKEKLVRQQISDTPGIIASHLANFSNVKTFFHGLDNSHIPRTEVNTILKWSDEELAPNQKPLIVLTGEAGSGKSVIIKQFINSLKNRGTAFFAIKADAVNTTNEESVNSGLSIECILNVVAQQLSEHGRCIFIIDQIDALSQNLSTDRGRINNIMAVINFLCEKCPENVRIVVSCRKFDLQYEVLFHPLHQGQKVEVAPLTVDNVKCILALLNTELPKRLNEQTITFLRNPQNLDVYCRVFSRTNVAKDFTDYRELFDCFWWNSIDSAKLKGLDTIKVEQCIFNLALKMQEQETLFPHYLPRAADRDIVNYLASQGIVSVQNDRISFFHQRFYDHAIAKFYMDSERLFIRQVVESHQHQGLRMRSTIKLILDYESEYDRRKYQADLSFIIKSDDVRPHMKEIALTHLGNQPTLYENEKHLISYIHRTSSAMFKILVERGMSNSCISYCSDLHKSSLPGVLMGTTDFYIHATLLERMAAFDLEQSIKRMECISDTASRHKMAEIIIMSCLDFKNPLAVKWYMKLKETDCSHPYLILDRIAASNLELALEEFQKQLEVFLTGSKNKIDFHEIERLHDSIMGKFPKELYVAVRNGYVSAIKNTASARGNGRLDDAGIFNSLMSHNTKLIFEWLTELLMAWKEDHYFVRNEIRTFISMNEVSAAELAFKAIAAFPEITTDIVLDILKDRVYVYKILNGYGSCLYYFFLALSESWACFTISDREWYLNYIVNYHDDADSLHSKDSKSTSGLYYPHLWRRRWKFLHTIPEHDMPRLVFQHKQELVRRFGIFQNMKPSGVTMAHVSGSLVKEDAALKFKRRHWLDFMTKVDEHKQYRHGRWRHFDIRGDFDNFRKCVEQRTEYFMPLIDDIFVDDNIRIGYKIAALEGLIASGAYNERAWELMKIMIISGCMETYYHKLSDMMKLLAKDGGATEEIVSECLRWISVPYCSQRTFADKDNIQEKLNDSISDVLNSSHGQMLEVIVAIASSEDAPVSAVNALKQFITGPATSQVLKSFIFYLISHTDFHDESIEKELVQLLLDGYDGQDYLYLNPQIIFDMWFEGMECAGKHMKRAINNKATHKTVAQIMFLSSCSMKVGKESAEILEQILSHDNPAVIAGLIKIALKHFHYEEYHKPAETLLRRFSDDTRSEIGEAYCLYCDEFEEDDIDLFMEIYSGSKVKNRKELYHIHNYISKCIKRNPRKCIKFINEVISHLLKDNDIYYTEKSIKLLSDIYELLNDNEDYESREAIMDVIDKIYMSGESYLIRKLDHINS